MSDGLDWLYEIVFDPLDVSVVPGQMDMGLVSLRVWDLCLCGGAISVEADGDVMEAVARHLQSNRHQEWRVLGGMGLPVDPEKFGHVPVAT